MLQGPAPPRAHGHCLRIPNIFPEGLPCPPRLVALLVFHRFCVSLCFLLSCFSVFPFSSPFWVCFLFFFVFSPPPVSCCSSYVLLCLCEIACSSRLFLWVPFSFPFMFCFLCVLCVLSVVSFVSRVFLILLSLAAEGTAQSPRMR